MGGFIKQALIRNLLCVLIFPYQKLSNLCVLQALHLYIWEILLFSCKNKLLATLLRVFCEISLIAPQKSVYFGTFQMYFYFALCLCFIKILHKLNFMLFACLLRKLFILWYFHFKMSNSMLYAMFGILVQH